MPIIIRLRILSQNPLFFLYLVSAINAIFSFLIFRVLGFAIIILPFFLLVSFMMIALGAISVKILPEKFPINKNKLLIQLTAAIVVTFLLFSIILGNTEIMVGFFEISISKILTLFFIYIIVLFPFYLYWGRLEYLAFLLCITESGSKSLFYISSLAGIFTGVLFDFYFFEIFGLLGTFISILAVLIAIIYSRKKRAIYFVIILYSIAVFFGIKYEHLFINEMLSESDEFNYKNNKLINDLMKVDIRAYKENVRHISQKWNTYCHYTLTKFNNMILGSYNGYPYWFYLSGNIPINTGFEQLPMYISEKNGNIAIIGSGGGAQVSMALNYNFRKIHAIEIIPNVLSDLTGQFAQYNDFIYKNPRVIPITGEGSSYIKNSSEKFDLIMSVNTESFIGNVRDFFEP